MRALRLLNLTVLSVLIGSSALIYAQEEKQQEEKPARQEEAKPQPKQEEAKPSRQEEAKPSKQDNKQMEKQDQKRGQETSREEAKPQGQEHPEMQNDRNRQGQEHPEMQNEHAQPAQRPEMQNDRGGHNQQAGRGGRIPDDKFRAQFGREHHFNARSVIVQGRPQFQYGGYNFELVDSWPADWAYTDDCYIDYMDGQYYLIDVLHPGIRLAVFVVMLTAQLRILYRGWTF